MSPSDFRLEPAPRSPYGAADLPSESLAEDGGGDAGGAGSRTGLAFSGVLALGTIFAHVNPEFGFLFYEQGVDAKHWPWALFEGLGAGTLRWTPPVAWVLSLSLAGVLLLVGAFLRGGRLRGAMALTAFALLATTLLPLQKTILIATGRNVALALLAGAAFASASGRVRAGRRVGALAALMLAILLVIPLAAPPADPDLPIQDDVPYVSELTRTAGVYKAVLLDQMAPMDGVAPLTAIELARRTLPELSWILGLAVGLLMLLGLRGRSTSWPLALLLVVAVLGPPAEIAVRELGQAREELSPGSALTSMQEVESLGRAAGVSLTMMLRLSLLPLALGLADVLRARRR